MTVRNTNGSIHHHPRLSALVKDLWMKGSSLREIDYAVIRWLDRGARRDNNRSRPRRGDNPARGRGRGEE